jgi:hypothetical protein
MKRVREQREQDQDQDQEKQLMRRFNLPGCGISGLFIWLLLGLAVASITWGPLSNRFDERTRINYSTFRQHVQAGEVEKVTVIGQQIQGRLKEPVEQGQGEDEGENVDAQESQG